MAKKAINNCIVLQRNIRDAQPGDYVDLDIGAEYQGPLLIDKPIILRGHGTQSPFFSKQVPCMIITSSGVQINNLELVGLADSVSVLCAQNVHPDFINSNLNGQMTSMSENQAIDLGEIFHRRQANSYFELDLPEQGKVVCLDNCRGWLRVVSGSRNKAGKQLFQIICDTSSLSAGAMAVGNIEIIADAFRESYWIMAMVLEQELEYAKDGIYLLNENGHKIYFENGFLIGNKQFPGCGDDKQAIVLKESGETWAIFAPWNTKTPTILNGKPLTFGQRSLLVEGSRISVGGINLTVQRKFKPGAFSASQSLLDFGVLGVALPQQKVQVLSSKYGKASIIATVPWLDVSPSKIDCQPGKSVDITLSVKTKETNLDAGKYRERGAILLQDDEETLSLDVSMEITAHTIIPKVSSPLSFGVISENWNTVTATTIVKNDGVDKWVAVACADQPWLTIDPPDFEVPPGQSFSLIVRINENILNLAWPGSYTAVVNLEGAGINVSIPVAVRLSDLARPLDIMPKAIDLGSIDSWQVLPSALLHVTNTQNHPLEIRVESELNWIDVEPKQVSCQPYQSLFFVVKFNEDEVIKGLRVKKYNIADAIKLFVDGKEYLIGLSVDVKTMAGHPEKAVTSVLPLAFDISMPVIDLGNILNWNNSLPNKEIILTHNQPGSVIIELEATVPWLTVNPESVVCPPEGCIVSVNMLGKNYSQGLRARRYEISDGIIIKGGDVVKKIPVRVNLSGVDRSSA